MTIRTPEEIRTYLNTPIPQDDTDLEVLPCTISSEEAFVLLDALTTTNEQIQCSADSEQIAVDGLNRLRSRGTERKPCVIQDWAQELPLMQQSVLIAAVRGPDGIKKDHVAKVLCRWLRRSFLLSAFEGSVLETPDEPGGGQFYWSNSWVPPICTMPYQRI